MATIILDFPGDSLPRWIAAKATKYGYQDEIMDNGLMIPNPESQIAFVKRLFIRGEIQDVRNQEANIAEGIARQDALGAPTIEVEIT